LTIVLYILLMLNAWENLHFAALELVRSTPIKQRLVAAYRRHLVSVKDEQLPGEVRESFAYVMNSLKIADPLPHEDAVAASVRKMSVPEAEECATLIIEILSVVCRAHHAASRQGSNVVQMHTA